MTPPFRLLVGLALLAPVLAPAAGRSTLDFDPDWRFLQADTAGAERRQFDDHEWRHVSLPHTFNDVDTFDNWSTPGHRGEQIQWSGRTWYRKTFRAPAEWRDRRVYIEFEAARQVADVYLNGRKLGTAKTGFTPFGFDLTPYLKFGDENVLAVMVDNRFMRDPLDAQTIAEMAKRGGAKEAPGSVANPNLAQLQGEFNKQIPERVEDLAADQIPWNNPHWHPAHGGLYRNVRLYVTDPLHISLPLYSFLETVGPYAYATDVTPARAGVTVEVPVQNDRTSSADVELTAALIDADGREVATARGHQTVAAGGRTNFTLATSVASPRLWEPAYPHVYRVVSTLRVGGAVVDSSEVPLGIRVPHWTADRGLFLNGNPLKLHGWGQKPTDEWPGLGAALPDWLHFYTLQLMQAAGGNFVRWGHSAAGRAQIEAGDQLGIIADQPGVDGESDTVGAAWKLRVIAFRDTLIYFRNHPSILVWEGGNQKVTRAHGAELRALFDKYDPHGGRAYAHRRADATTAEFMDVGVGTEGGREIARLPVFEGEYDREESPRRVWDNASPPNFGYPEAKGMTYQLTSEQFAVNEITQYKKIAPAWHSGGANWIFSDSTSGGRVPAEVTRASGEVDGARLPKEAYYVCSVIFRADPQVHIIGHWTYPAGTKKAVYVASNADDVELFVNGRSLGRGARSDTYLFTFKDVAFEPGEIKAVATRGGTVVATDQKRTAGPAVALRLTPIVGPRGLLANGADVALFDVEAVDARGERCPTFQQRADFTVEGPAVWRGGYNSGKLDSVNHPFLDLEAGINRVAIRTTLTAGAITVHATAAGLRPATAGVTSQTIPLRDGVTPVVLDFPATPLPRTAPAHPELGRDLGGDTGKAPRVREAMLGRFIKTLNYTGPMASIVHVETNAANGRNVYVDRDYTFSDLPAALNGADWLQVADADQPYSAVDLIELAVKGGTTVTIAHDDRVPRPEWLTRQFQDTGAKLTVNGRAMELFTHASPRDESLTLGSNSDAAPQTANMYVVLANAAAAGANP